MERRWGWCERCLFTSNLQRLAEGLAVEANAIKSSTYVCVQNCANRTTTKPNQIDLLLIVIVKWNPKGTSLELTIIRVTYYQLTSISYGCHRQPNNVNPKTACFRRKCTPLNPDWHSIICVEAWQWGVVSGLSVWHFVFFWFRLRKSTINAALWFISNVA